MVCTGIFGLILAFVCGGLLAAMCLDFWGGADFTHKSTCKFIDLKYFLRVLHVLLCTLPEDTCNTSIDIEWHVPGILTYSIYMYVDITTSCIPSWN